MKKINNKNIKLLAYVLSGDFSAENMKVTRSELKMVEDCPRGVYFIDFTEPISRFIACKRYWKKELDGFEKEKVGYQLLNELSELISKHSWFYWQNGESGKYSFSFSAEFLQRLNELRNDIRSTKYAQYFFDFIDQSNLVDDYKEKITIKKSWYSQADCARLSKELKLLNG